MKRVIKLLFKIFLKDVKNFFSKIEKEKIKNFAIFQMVGLMLLALALFFEYVKMQK